MKFNKRIMLSLTERQLKEIDEVVDNNSEIYQSRTHYIRIAVLEKLRKEDK